MPPKNQRQPYQLIQTKDGSYTCYHRETRQHFHNMAGAFTEAFTHYVQLNNPVAVAKRIPANQQATPLRILDVCYGLGYNAWVAVTTVLDQAPHPVCIEVTAIENDPELVAFVAEGTRAIFSDRRFDTLFEHFPDIETRLADYLKNPRDTLKLHSDKGCHVVFRLVMGDLRKVIPPMVRVDAGQYHLICHDAFSPEAMPELWTQDLFACYYKLLVEDGIVATYSAAGAVRGGLSEAGFVVTCSPGVGDRESGTLGVKVPVSADPNARPRVPGYPMSVNEVQFMQSRAGIPYRDPLLNLSREQIVKKRGLEQAHSSRMSGNEARKTYLE
ncbi:MAG: tRNA (5-methylaminomethyl-2-thiouridine)(34)-methyltransferase MnmD [Candidatus Melainabacteria bacterium]